eukprot:74969_1
MLKQILISSMCKMSSTGDLLNSRLINSIASFSNTLSCKCPKIKMRFLSDNIEMDDCKLWEDNKYSRIHYPLHIHIHAITFCIESTHPNPNTYKVRKIYDDNNNKYDHPQHICYDTFKNIHTEWCEKVKHLCDKYEKSVPCLQWFLDRRPIYIYPVDENDFSN